MVEIPNYKLNVGSVIPSLGFGTWGLSEGSEAVEAVSEALRLGYRLIDTARIYGNEQSVGQAVRQSKISREEIFVTTKLWESDQGYEPALRAFDASRERLGLDYIDLYLIHWPNAGSRAYKDSWRAMTEIYERGDVKAIGVSNFTAEQLEDLMRAATLTPAVNQIEFNLFVYHEQSDTVRYCKHSGIILEAYSPLSRARKIDHPQTTQIAKKHSKTNAQIMLRWAIQHGSIPIPKSADPERMKENLKVFDFELDEDDMTKLDKLGSHSLNLF